MTDNELTLVTAGTGKTGRRIAQRLQARGRAVRIGSRSGRPPFDWADPSSWAPALDGASAVYLAYAPDAGFPGADETIGAFARQAVRAGARRIVALTGRGEQGACAASWPSRTPVRTGRSCARRSSRRTSART